jgi:hypothetical protein
MASQPVQETFPVRLTAMVVGAGIFSLPQNSQWLAQRIFSQPFARVIWSL